MTYTMIVVCVLVFVAGCAAPFVFLLVAEAAARRAAAAHERPHSAPAALYAPAEAPAAPLPPLAPEATRIAPVVDLAERRNRRRPQGAAPGPEGPLGRITKDASTGLGLRPAGETFGQGVGAAAAHLEAAVAGAQRGGWALARVDVALAALALVRVLGSMPTDDGPAAP